MAQISNELVSRLYFKVAVYFCAQFRFMSRSRAGQFNGVLLVSRQFDYLLSSQGTL